MKRYIKKVIVPFISKKRESLKLNKDRPALAVFDCFEGQTTPAIHGLLENHSIITVKVLANCTDKLQPLDVSLNKPMKDEMKWRFQIWYAEEVQKQLLDKVPLDQVKIDMPSSVIKNKSANWMISSWQTLQGQPEVAINGFRKAGILHAVDSVTSRIVIVVVPINTCKHFGACMTCSEFTITKKEKGSNTCSHSSE